MSKQLLPISPPFQPGGQRYLWDRRVYHRQATRGPEREPADLEKGCMVVTVGEGEIKSRHKVLNRELLR